VQANIIVDAIKLLKRIRSLESQRKDAEISAKIRYLYWEYVKAYVKARLRPVIPFIPSWVRKVIKWVMRIK
jgi:hypothetical protein